MTTEVLRDTPYETATTSESAVSAVSWAAILAGAAVAVAISLLLATLGAGFGFASISAWPNAGASVATFSVITAVWLVVLQWIASAGGGYVTGRLRTKWASVHTHEVFFRDTAHGFVMWAVATVLTVSVVAMAAGAAAREGARAAATISAGAAQGAVEKSPVASVGSVSGYSVDSLFRGTPVDAHSSTADVNAEALRILSTALTDEGMTAADRDYLAQLVAARTSLSQAEAQQRVDTVVAQVKAAEVKARAAADAARKVAATTALFTALAMLIGAFIASVAAALGGRERDLHP